jgi:hypothetical protein
MARQSWLDEASGTPMIDQYARQLTTFLDATADGHVDDTELKAQEGRVAALMREIEPMLDEKQHGKVTQLLCELTAYDIMQMLHAISSGRPKTKFRG